MPSCLATGELHPVECAEVLLATMINGEALEKEQMASGVIALDDRGLQYGDGLFETLLLRNGVIRFLEDHLARLHAGCVRLNITAPKTNTLADELQRLAAKHENGALKLILTRGRSARGYRPIASLQPTRILSLYAHAPSPSNGVSARWCKTRLARNAALAGIKHLNRLEQVLAQSEWSDERIAEGLMLDTEGELVSGTSNNVFVVIDGVLVTPDLRYSGVQGVMRKNVLAAAERLGLTGEQRAIWPIELSTASEVFITNALRGIRSVHTLDERQWEAGPVARALIAELDLN
jgi:4-amino-4-deoxychorismate lyase